MTFWHCSLALALAAVTASACGGTAIIDGDDASGAADGGGGAGAGGSPTGTPTGIGGSGGDPFVPDGIARPGIDAWELRVVTFPISCATAGVDPPFDECGWYDIDIELFVNDLVDGLVITPESGLGTSYYTTTDSGTGPSCPGTGGGGGLFGTVTIVDVQDDRVIVQLGPDWDLLTFDPALSPAGQHTLALCN